MKARTEDDANSLAPLEVKLGKNTYLIPLLAVLPQREWRKKLLAELAPILAGFNFKVDGSTMAKGLTAALLTFPEKLSDLVFSYREYGVAFETLERSDIPKRELYAKFLALQGQGPLPEAPDFARDEIFAEATEEQIANAFSAIMAVAFPFIPQLGMVTNLLRATAN